MTSIFEKYLTVWVGLCILIGILLGMGKLPVPWQTFDWVVLATKDLFHELMEWS